MTLKPDGKRIPNDNFQNSSSVSVILSTQNDGLPLCISPQKVKSLVPRDVRGEIIIAHYNNASKSVSEESSVTRPFDGNIGYDSTHTVNEHEENDISDFKIKGNFTQAIMKAVELSNGRFILVIDGDFPYPDDVIHKIMSELINSPNSIIIASKYLNGSSVQKLPLLRTILSKGARTIVRHGLNVQHVQDPLSGCFGISHSLLKDIRIEGKGDELLLEIIVKLSRTKKHANVSVKEIPFKQKGILEIKKIDTHRIISYSKAVWHLYRYGSKSEGLADHHDISEQKKHKSVLFLSKAGRFFTVGASGLLINYAVSLLLSTVVPNIWYIYATFAGILVSISSNFMLNKVWTFEDWDFSLKHTFKQYGLFLLLCSFGAVVQLSLVSLFFGYYHIQYPISLITAVAIASIGNFLLNKKVTFGEKIWE